MADDIGEERRLDPEAAAAPNRDRRGEPAIIDGEVTARDEAPSAATSEEPAEAEEPPRPEPPSAAVEPAKASRRGFPPFIAACLGGLVGGAVVAAGFWFEGSTVEASFSDRLAAAEAPVGELTRRVAALETDAQGAKSAAEAAKSSQADIQAARSDAAKALALATKAASAAAQPANAPSAASPPMPDAGAIEARLDKLETALSSSNKPASVLTPFEDRLAKIEAALATPKNESRVAPEQSGAARSDWAALAVAAEAACDRLASGEPYPAEMNALERLGADSAKTVALKPFAEKGAPTAAALAAGFGKIAPDALKAATPKEGGGVMDRLMSNMSKVVKITPVGETAGDDPAALISQVGAALGRGEIGAAMVLWARLPEPARRASQDWASGAEALLAAQTAAQSILNDAMGKLAGGDKR